MYPSRASIARRSLSALAIATGVTFLSGGHVSAAQDVCQPQGDIIDVSEGTSSVTVTAPEGQLITGYCVKAGSEASGDGPVYVTLDEPVSEVTITYPSGKDISHYIVFYTAAPVETTTTPAPTTTAVSTTTLPVTTTTIPGTTTSVPGTTVPETTTTGAGPATTAPGPTTTSPGTVPGPTTTTPHHPNTTVAVSTTFPGTPGGELPETGASTTLLALIAGGLLALGGTALLIRRFN